MHLFFVINVLITIDLFCSVIRESLGVNKIKFGNTSTGAINDSMNSKLDEKAIAEQKTDDNNNEERKDHITESADVIFRNYFLNNLSCGSKTEQYYKAFVEEDITEFSLLLEVDDEYLEQDLKINNRIHRKKILKKIDALKIEYDNFQKFFDELQVSHHYGKLSSNGIVIFNIFYQQFSKLDVFSRFIGLQFKEDALKIWTNLPKHKNTEEGVNANVAATAFI